MVYYIIFAVTVAFGLVVLGIIDTHDNDRTKEVDNVMLNHYKSYYPKNNSVALPYIYFPSSSIYTKLYCAYGMTVVSGSYLANVYFGLAVFKELRRNRSFMSSKTLSLHKQINRIMLIQAITPLVILSGPILICLSCLVTQIKRFDFLYVNCLMVWMPVMPSYLTLILVPAFRQRVAYALWRPIVNPRKFLSTVSTITSMPSSIVRIIKHNNNVT